jgi:hypothetical protein
MSSLCAPAAAHPLGVLAFSRHASACVLTTMDGLVYSVHILDFFTLKRIGQIIDFDLQQKTAL